MMMENKPTKKEHYVPRVFLKGFSSTENRLYFYDLNSRCYSNQMVPVETICREKYLYELRNKNGEIVFTNRIEKALSVLEKQLSQHKRAIHSRINVFSTNVPGFLTETEKNYWLFYLAIQIFRMPKVIDEITKYLNEISDKSDNKFQSRNNALFLLLPFFRKVGPDSSEVRLIYTFISVIERLNCAIVYDDEHRLFTSDNPMYLYSPTKRAYDCDCIIFPVDSSVCFVFSKGDYPDNVLIPINDNTYECICKSISYSANNMLFSKRKFSDKELSWIHHARNDRKHDS